jgi:hypothetical protein
MEFLISYYRRSEDYLFKIFIFILIIGQANSKQDYYFHIHYDLFSLDFNLKIFADRYMSISKMESVNCSYLIQPDFAFLCSCFLSL